MAYDTYLTAWLSDHKPVLVGGMSPASQYLLRCGTKPESLFAVEETPGMLCLRRTVLRFWLALRRYGTTIRSFNLFFRVESLAFNLLSKSDIATSAKYLL